MNFIVSFTPPPADQTREARRRRVLRQRGLLVAATMLLVAGMAALPMPVWDASAQLADRASELRGWIEDARSDDDATKGIQASGLIEEEARDGATLTHLLTPHDRLVSTRLLLSMARTAGLVITRTSVAPDAPLLLTEEARQRDVAVLGTSVAQAADTTPRVAGTPLALQADRFVLEGRGRASSLLLFCGVLGAMPAPLRLRSLDWQASGPELRFTITMEKLRAGAAASQDAMHDTVQDTVQDIREGSDDA